MLLSIFSTGCGLATLCGLCGLVLEVLQRLKLIKSAPGRVFLVVAATLLLGSLLLGGLVDYLRAKEGIPRTLLNWTHKQLDRLLLFVICTLVPAIVLFSADHIQDHVRQVISSPLTADRTSLCIVVGRLLQLVFITLFSVFPALLFFAFDRERLGTLREKFTAQLFRFDPSVKSKRDISARYGRQMDEVYGPERHNGTVRYLPSRRSPLFVASLMLALGWTLTFLSTDVPPDSSGGTDLLAYFVPRPHPLTFGFLGAYFYSLNTLFRGYARRDLQPKTYSHITIRIFLVMILTWVLEELWALPVMERLQEQHMLHALVFLVGIVPETGLVLIQETVRSSAKVFKRVLRFQSAPIIDQHAPLTSLDGIDLYDRARLQDEGVTNIEGLAHHDLVELMLQTRIPAPQLLDWADQAILHLHTNVSGRNEEPPRMLDTLRQYGIRTATDLLDAHEKAVHRHEEVAFLSILSPCEMQGALRMQTLLDAIHNEEWIDNLRCWRKPYAFQVRQLKPPAQSANPPEAEKAPPARGRGTRKYEPMLTTVST
ncbi:hypothetical protein [Hyalangium versicolor]|uniref:hypothetical protein n=1 Tax=Hyalangium versicolor TaxID=2861190 RepID=UPI001CCF6F56|nr:hypothetical protein [Hyalangium versicolor]